MARPGSSTLRTRPGKQCDLRSYGVNLRSNVAWGAFNLQLSNTASICRYLRDCETGGAVDIWTLQKAYLIDVAAWLCRLCCVRHGAVLKVSLRPGESPEEAQERRLRESQRVEERVIPISDVRDWDRETSASGDKLVVVEVGWQRNTAAAGEQLKCLMCTACIHEQARINNSYRHV